jgi:CheY-like chemotaxis protein
VGEPLHEEKGGQISVLYAEGDATSRFMGTRFLKRCGFEVVESFDGEDVLNQLAIRSFDVVLLDTCMPKLNGQVVLDRIRHGRIPGVTSELPVIAVTARAVEEDRERFLAMGMNEYLVKPFAMQQLQETIEGVVGNTRSGANS